jgi:hypothetical protein
MSVKESEGGNPFGGTMPVLTRSMAKKKPSSEVINHIIDICGFPDDSTLVEYINEQQWTELADVIMITIAEVDEFKLVNKDGSYKAKPMLHHIRRFKGFLLLYNRKCRKLSTTLDEEDVMDISRQQYLEYVGSPNFHTDLHEGLYSQNQNATTAATAAAAAEELTAQEFRRGVKRDKTHYSDLKDDKHFNSWNCGFVATAFMHHTHHVLDEEYVPRTPTKRCKHSCMQFLKSISRRIQESRLLVDTR